MNVRTLKKICRIALAIFVLLAAAFYWIGGDQLHYRTVATDMMNSDSLTGEITADRVITQQIAVDGGELTGLTLKGATYARENTGTLVLDVLTDGEVIATRELDIARIPDGEKFTVSFDPILQIPGESAQLRITAPQSESGNAVALYMGSTRTTVRNQISVSLSDDECIVIDGERQSAQLCVSVASREHLWFGTYYWYLAAAVLLGLAVYCGFLIRAAQAGKIVWVYTVCNVLQRYSYLMRQLVSRDFKTKYKRSVLGVLWSFLNPLLSMAVQYVIFSRVFTSDIPYYAVYLLSGIVCFNFFNEAVTLTSTSITGNASLITKVYVPKYIYPVTRTVSSAVNLAMALVPLMGVVFLTGLPIRPAILLMPFAIICLFAFTLGMGLALASAMVFFQDTQFLWTVISMLWTYATPIFYPESIIPSRFLVLYKMNPLYHIIRFVRTVLIDGVSPEPKAYLLTIIASFAPLAIGLIIFKKTQDEFVLYL